MDTSADKPRYRIKTVGMKTGIPPITLRAWERRYQILSPNREENRYRLYSNADIQLLQWLKMQVDSGVPISLAAAELKQKLAAGEEIELPEMDDDVIVQSKSAGTTESFADQLFQVLLKHDETAALKVLTQAKNQLSLLQLFEQVITPVLIRIGEEWYTGNLLVATEHFASNFFRASLLTIFQRLPSKRSGPRILVGGSPGDLHELGPLMVSILLREKGYLVEFLGPDSPLEDLADYAAVENPHMIILSATTTESAETLRGFKARLDKNKRPPLFAFGGGAFSYQPALVDQVPGYYLGKTLSQSIQRVRELLPPGK